MLTCLIIVVLLVIVARGQRWFQNYATYMTSFPNGGALHEGSPVMIQGLDAGMVTKLDLGEDNRVAVRFELFRRYSDCIREGSETKLIRPIVGMSWVEVVLGPKDGPLVPEGGFIPSKGDGSADLDELIETTTKLARSLEDPKGDLMRSLANINRATKGFADAMAKEDSSLRKFLEEGELYDELNSAVSHLDSVLAMIDESSPEIRDSITEARRNLEEAGKVIEAMQKSVFLRGHIRRRLKENSTLRYEGRAD